MRYRVVIHFKRVKVCVGRNLSWGKANGRKYRHEQLYALGWYYIQEQPTPIIEIASER